MSTAASKKLMTADEFYDFVHRPENADRAFELVRGEVVEMSLPGELHGVVSSNANWLLSNFMRQRRRGRVLCNDPGIILERDPDTVRGPDIVFFEDTRKYNELNPKWVEDPPVLAIEVLSPNDRIGKVTLKITQFLHSGIRIVWLIDPAARDVTVHRKGKDPYVVEDGQELTGEDVLPDLRVRVADFFFVAEGTNG
ncbi:MAG: Uma2 family endonuclease [Gemmataceae bacterium]|nr:Uma2 family endonuclease [Gemmataceae bacterium]